MSVVIASPDNALSPAQSSGLDVRPLTGRIGAQVQGLHLSGKLDAATVQALRQVLNTYKVLFFRGQQHLDNAEHEAFGRLWGEIEPHPTVPAPDGTSLFELDSSKGARADAWHTDVTFQAAPPKVCVLRAVELPPYGGDTLWANAVTGYHYLPAPLKTLAEGLRAVHANDHDYAEARLSPHASHSEVQSRDAYRKVFRRRHIEAEHPVVHIHQETGEKSLLLGNFVKRFKGLNSLESASILQILHERLFHPQNTVRWQWHPGDIAVWDNHATAHIATNDYGDIRRIVRRVTVTGHKLIGLDGRLSEQISDED